MKLDQLDLKILRLLQDPEMLTPKLTKIAKSVDSTNATIYRRIEVLKKEGVIVGHTTQIDMKLVGKNIEAFLCVRLVKGVEKAEADRITRKISELEGIEAVYLPISHWNYLVVARFSNIEQLNKLVQEELRKLPIEEVEVELLSKTAKEGATISNLDR
ncbi:MAG: Lrp/AsnC family transcriptional regulator [Candidatus Micrarchaeota archaeon]|nr:Lrp/AsnC family transcriptional regulator [Candidatus Micrarchaeota archaeon]MDE1847848.1 Lrp/AsnC family transcriptional regulator [Candidatus Micrarchaeota archaeon]MDE1864346.1 Lrp/AsnC family transcriptional regulator [Candidatus Micrarchaeota archaeon]